MLWKLCKENRGFERYVLSETMCPWEMDFWKPPKRLGFKNPGFAFRSFVVIPSAFENYVTRTEASRGMYCLKQCVHVKWIWGNQLKENMGSKGTYGLKQCVHGDGISHGDHWTQSTCMCGWIPPLSRLAHGSSLLNSTPLGQCVACTCVVDRSAYGASDDAIVVQPICRAT